MAARSRWLASYIIAIASLEALCKQCSRLITIKNKTRLTVVPKYNKENKQ